MCRPSVCAAFLLLSGTLFANVLRAETFYVAPTGNDAASGKSNQPLASLAGARAAIRRLGSHHGAVTVWFAEGIYPIEEAVTLEPRDSGTEADPIVYAAAPGTHPVISGGRQIRGWHAIEGGLWSSAGAVGLETEQLWINGRRASRARIPLEGLPKIDAVHETAIGPGPTLPPAYSKFNVSRARQQVDVTPELLQPLAEVSSSELRMGELIILHRWNMSRRPIDAVDVKRGEVTVSGAGTQSFSPWWPGGHFYLENVRPGLVAPGTWFRDARGVLLYHPLPNERIERVSAVVPIADQLLKLAGAPTEGRFVQNVVFRGLTFAYSQWLTPAGGIAGSEGLDDLQSAAHIGAAIEADGACRIWFDRCSIEHTGRHGIWFRRGCSDDSLTHCELSDLGAGGIKIGDMTVPRYAFELTHHVTVKDTRITAGGRIFASAAGIWIGQSDSNILSHNSISDFYHNGISVGWSWRYEPSIAYNNLIEFNRIDNLGQAVLSDIGGIYTLGPSPGTVIRNNVISHVRCAEYGGWGIYNDEGSSDILIENNLVYRTQTGGYVMHYGKDVIVRNNIFALSSSGQVQRSKAEDHLQVTFTHNIVYWSGGPLLVGRGGWTTPGFQFDHNLYFDVSGASLSFAGRTLAAWQTGGEDAASVVADPKFVGPERGDFRLQAGSAAELIGFKPFDPSLAGVRAP